MFVLGNARLRHVDVTVTGAQASYGIFLLHGTVLAENIDVRAEGSVDGVGIQNGSGASGVPSTVPVLRLANSTVEGSTNSIRNEWFQNSGQVVYQDLLASNTEFGGPLAFTGLGSYHLVNCFDENMAAIADR
jgi:hypothetical protein